jgi:hypothetical protein
MIFEPALLTKWCDETVKMAVPPGNHGASSRSLLEECIVGCKARGRKDGHIRGRIRRLLINAGWKSWPIHHET